MLEWGFTGQRDVLREELSVGSYLLEFGDLLLGEEDEDRGWGLLGLTGGRAAGRSSLRARIRGSWCRWSFCRWGIGGSLFLGGGLLLGLLWLLRLEEAYRNRKITSYR